MPGDGLLPKGYTCPNCSQEITYSSWVYAHWHKTLFHTCECKRRNLLFEGVLVGTEIKSGSNEFFSLDDPKVAKPICQECFEKSEECICNE